MEASIEKKVMKQMLYLVISMSIIGIFLGLTVLAGYDVYLILKAQYWELTVAVFKFSGYLTVLFLIITYAMFKADLYPYKKSE